VRTICSKCKTAYKPNRDELIEINLDPALVDKHTFYKGVGCDQCRNTGYKGRLGLFEVMVSTPDLRELISKQASMATITEYVKTKQQMRTMLEDGYAKIAEGKTTCKEVFNAVYSTMSV